MKNALRIAFAVAFTTVGIAACTSTPEAPQNTAPITSETPPASPSVTVVTTVTTVTVTNPAPPEAFVDTDSRLGYGSLKLGMTADEAIAAGLKGVSWGPNGEGTCTIAENVALSKKYGVERITLPEGAKTSKGIGVGSTVADVKRAYPDAVTSSRGYVASLGDAGVYTFSVMSKLNGPFTDVDEVLAVKLISKKLDCPNAAL
ncbi:hypothetical protein ACSHWB_14385 [Lentzea sp. HUAS TT2]|uniref:hypothetical protein n=1 Tax=Lentzea sp. HUAS TT2 TaxID=3447454 RepID=UPI003F6F905B